MNVIKKLTKKISPHLTHLYNSITRSAIYPDIVKLNKILPTLKPDKNNFLMESYRPINILHPVDKIYQEHVKNHLYNFAIENKIILPYHHGGMKKHGTDTALATILDNLYKHKENDKITCVLQTDLSSAYDTIDHSNMLKKLEFYEINGKPLELIRNYLCDRKQFVVLDIINLKFCLHYNVV